MQISGHGTGLINEFDYINSSLLKIEEFLRTETINQNVYGSLKRTHSELEKLNKKTNCEDKELIDKLNEFEEKIKELDQRISELIDKRFNLLKSYAKEDSDQTFYKILKVAANLSKHLASFKSSFHVSAEEASSRFTAWAIGKKFNKRYSGSYSYCHENTNIFRHFLGKSKKENLFICELHGKLKGKKSIDFSQSFTIHERMFYDGPRYRIYFSRQGYLNLKQCLGLLDLEGKRAGWMNQAKMNKFLGNINRFIDPKTTWTANTEEAYAACFGQTIQGNGKTYTPFKGDRAFPFQFNSLLEPIQVQSLKMNAGVVDKRSLSKTVIETAVSSKEPRPLPLPKTVKATQKTRADFVKRFSEMKNKKNALAARAIRLEACKTLAMVVVVIGIIMFVKNYLLKETTKALV